METVSRQIEGDLSDLIDEKVAAYGYPDASAYVRELISRDEARLIWLRREIQRGFDSGMSELTIDEIFDRVLDEPDDACASR